jgi:hypothetical protein
MIGEYVGVSILGDAKESFLVQAHDPGEKKRRAGIQGRPRENCRKTIDKRAKRIYHVPHGGNLYSLWFGD